MLIQFQLLSTKIMLVLLSHNIGDTDLSSSPSSGFLGSGSLFSVLQPFKPLTDAPDTKACIEEIEKWIYQNLHKRSDLVTYNAAKTTIKKKYNTAFPFTLLLFYSLGTILQIIELQYNFISFISSLFWYSWNLNKWIAEIMVI